MRVMMMMMFKKSRCNPVHMFDEEDRLKEYALKHCTEKGDMAYIYNETDTISLGGKIVAPVKTVISGVGSGKSPEITTRFADILYMKVMGGENK